MAIRRPASKRAVLAAGGVLSAPPSNPPGITSTIGKPTTGGVKPAVTPTRKRKTLAGSMFKGLRKVKDRFSQVKQEAKTEQSRINTDQARIIGTQATDTAGSSIGGTVEDPALQAAQEEAKKKKLLLAQRAASNTPRTILG